MKKNIITFLFGESQEVARQEEEIAENLQFIFDACAKEESGSIESKKTPLASALKAAGIPSADLELDTTGLCLVITDSQEYASIAAILAEPETSHKLAELGWIAVKSGDVAMANEPAEYRIRFFEIGEVCTSDGDKGEDEKALHKKAQEFASTEMDREDDSNIPDSDGLGKATDGDKPKKSIHDSIDVEALLAEALGSGDDDQDFSSKDLIRGQDLNDYVSDYVTEYNGQTDDQTMNRVINFARQLSEGSEGSVDVFTVFKAMEMAGLGKAEDFESSFYDGEEQRGER